MWHQVWQICSTMPNRKKNSIFIVPTQWLIIKILFQKKKTNAMVRISIIVQRSWVWIFSLLIFSFTNEMDDNKFLKKKKGLSCSSRNNHVPKGTRLKLLWGAIMFLEKNISLSHRTWLFPKKKRLKLFIGAT